MPVYYVPVPVIHLLLQLHPSLGESVAKHVMENILVVRQIIRLLVHRPVQGALLQHTHVRVTVDITFLVLVQRAPVCRIAPTHVPVPIIHRRHVLGQNRAPLHTVPGRDHTRTHVMENIPVVIIVPADVRGVHHMRVHRRAHVMWYRVTRGGIKIRLLMRRHVWPIHIRLYITRMQQVRPAR